MKNINEIDITRRCGYKPTDKVEDFLKEMTDADFQKAMKEVISWKDDVNPSFRKAGLEAEQEYAPYLQSKIKDIPEDVLNRYTHYWYTNGTKFFIYQPCCS